MYSRFGYGSIYKTGTLDEDESIAFEGDLMVFPQPAKSDLTVSLGIDIENNPIDVSIVIYDLSGKAIQTQRWNQLSNPMFEKTIDVSRLNSGVYILSVESSNGVKEYQKIVIN